MFVAIDESGDLGFRLDRGSSPYFALAMVVFADGEAASLVQAAVRHELTQLRAHPEFKFSRCNDRQRAGFFSSMQHLNFEVHASLVEKANLKGPGLKNDPAKFHDFCLARLVTSYRKDLRPKRIILDGARSKSVRQRLQMEVRRLMSDMEISLVLRDSHREPLLQVADMYVGAAVRIWEGRRAGQQSEWHSQVVGKMPSVITFD